MAHHHEHGSDDVTRDVPATLQRALVGLVVGVVVAALAGAALLWPSGASGAGDLLGDPGDLQDATVTAVQVVPCTGTTPGEPTRCEQAEIELTSGPGAGSTGRLETVEGGVLRPLEVGDRIVVGSFDGPSGRVHYFQDFQRRVPLAVLALAFVAAVVAFGRWRGLRALLALGCGLLVVVRFAIPSILDGHDPLAVSLVAATLVMVVVLFVTDGLTLRATVAVLGTGASLALIAVLAWAFSGAAELTGAASEEALFLRAAATEVNLRGLLLGGFVLGALGVLDDMTVTQVSATWELHDANRALGFRRLYGAAARIGRDHVASTVNTLVLAYAGASLPLLIFFTQSAQPLGDVVTSEVVAVEVVRTLVGSLGLVASVPITTALAALVLTRRRAGGGAPAPEAGGDPSVAPAATWTPPAEERRWRQLDDAGPAEPG